MICPNCEKEIGNGIEQCPYCGCHFAVADSPAAESVDRPARGPRFAKSWKSFFGAPVRPFQGSVRNPASANPPAAGKCVPEAEPEMTPASADPIERGDTAAAEPPAAVAEPVVGRSIATDPDPERPDEAADKVCEPDPAPDPVPEPAPAVSADELPAAGKCVPEPEPEMTPASADPIERSDTAAAEPSAAVAGPVPDLIADLVAALSERERPVADSPSEIPLPEPAVEERLTTTDEPEQPAVGNAAVDVGPDSMARCGHCGGEIRPGAAFCKWCGAPVAAGTDTAKCVECGKTINRNAPYCKWCGAKNR